MYIIKGRSTHISGSDDWDISKEAYRQFSIFRNDLVGISRGNNHLRKFSWIIAITLVGTVIFEFFHPDKERRSKAIIKDWQHKTQGGAYNPRLPQKENPVATPKTDTETEKKD